MLTQKINIGKITAILIGEASRQVYLFIHGKHGQKEEALDFASLVVPLGFQVLSIDLPEHGERKKQATKLLPWTVVPELQQVAQYLQDHYSEVSLRANSIGAWLAMLAIPPQLLCQALFVSPILDMHYTIQCFLKWSAISLEQLQAEKSLPTPFGEDVSWEYYQYTLHHPITQWTVPTHILFAGLDTLTSLAVAKRFSQEHNCQLTIYQEGEHWFHTPEQLKYLHNWEKQCTTA